MLIKINRKGKFEITKTQYTPTQCGAEGVNEYLYHVIIESSDKELDQYGFVYDNMVIKKYFDDTYGRDKTPALSCEEMCVAAVQHFYKQFRGPQATHSFIDLKRIFVEIHGANVSYISAEWQEGMPSPTGE
jgi:hypothetical protein